MSSPNDQYTADDATRTWDSVKDTPPRNPPGGDGHDGGGGKQSQTLFADARQRARVFTGDDGVCYLAEHARGIEAYPIRSTRTRRWLNRLFQERMRKTPGAQVIAEAIDALESIAEISGVYPVRVRIAAMSQRVLLDLGNDDGQVVDITSCGWVVRGADYWQDSTPPCYFVRPKHAQALPLPDAGGSLDDVRVLLAAVGADEMSLVLSFLLHCFQRNGDFWTLVLQGEQGAAKSHTAEVLRMLIDPARVRSSGPPRDEDALATHANTVGIVVLDNLSRLEEWLSDAICRLSTGSGIMKRALYTDMEVSGWFGRRPVIITTITDIVRAGDLLDRSLIVPLPPLKEDTYVSKDILWEQFDERHPMALGGLLNALVKVLAVLPAVRRDYQGRLPRMTDATLYGLALERTQGAPADPDKRFLALYKANHHHAMGLQLEGSRLTTYLKRLTGSPWVGTMTQLLARLDEELEIDCGVDGAREARRERSWPKTPNSLSAMLTRLAPALRGIGFTIERGKTKRGEPFVYTISRTRSAE